MPRNTIDGGTSFEAATFLCSVKRIVGNALSPTKPKHSEIGITMPQLTFEHLMQTLDEDPWRAFELSRAQHHSSRRREWELAALAYAFARWLRDRPGELRQFYLKPFFRGGYRPNPDKLLLHVLQYQRDDRHGEDGDRVQGHAAALRSAFNAGWTAEEVLAALIEHGGFAPLRRWFVEQFEDAADGDDCLEVEDDRRQLGLGPTGRDHVASACDPAADEDEYGSDGVNPGEGERSATANGSRRTVAVPGRRSWKYADDTEDLMPLEVLSQPAVFGEAMELKEEEYFDVRITRTKNGKFRYRRFEVTRLSEDRSAQ